MNPHQNTENGHTTIWLGNQSGQSQNNIVGQTFTANKANLTSIDVLSDVVTKPGHVELSIHKYDPQTNTWGEKIAGAQTEVQKSSGDWLHFAINAKLEPGQTYGFKLNANDTLIGMDELVSSAQTPFNGEEWVFNDKGLARAFHYFSLNFKLGLN